MWSHYFFYRYLFVTFREFCQKWIRLFHDFWNNIILPNSFQIATTLIKIITKLFDRANNGDQNANAMLAFWIRRLDSMITVNTFLLELHEIASNHAKDGQTPRLFPKNPNIRADSKVENVSLRIALLDCSQFYGKGRGFHIDDPDIRKFSLAVTFGLVISLNIFFKFFYNL